MVSQIKSKISVVKPRDSVQVTFPSGLTLEGEVGTTIEEFLIAAEPHLGGYDSPIMGGVLDGKLRELSYPVKRDSPLRPVLLSSSDGGRIYRRSLVMLLATAINELWPDLKVNVSYSVPEGGFYCTLPQRQPFTSAELERLEAHMREIVEQNDPITKRIVPLDEAVALFKSRGEDDKVRLLEQRTRNDLTLYTLRGRSDYFYGYMLPSTGYLTVFRLIRAGDGFILQYPRKEHPHELHDIDPNSKINEVFKEADEWLRKLGVEDIGRLNRHVRRDTIQELLLVAEALHEQRIARIANEISRRYEAQGTRIIMIAGPSSSGKTTFSKRLAIQLLAHGLRPFTLEMDNYFVDRELTPRDEHGTLDFEALEAVNVPLFNKHLAELIRGEEVRLPRFDFIQGKSLQGRLVKLTPHQLIIIEGIHGLNPKLVASLPRESVFRIYVSALTPLNVDLHNRVSTTDSRLLRRIVRDASYRGHSATDTLMRWPYVRRGEKRNIFPYQENADVIFNSALVYELAALRPLAEPLLLQVPPNTPEHIEANRLLSFLRWVTPMTEDQVALIPDTSLLREFIGGSIFQDYHPGNLSTEETEAAVH
ncbi:MAG: nucleoside kinase [Chloroflexota bacterium]|nr:MAG: nucleoside kinase [Chloroflexota bacterium]